MLPIFRIIPVGGVFLAVAILLLALHPPRGIAPLSPTLLAAHGPLVDRDEHPELRQFLILAALDRADAVERLRVIPETHIPPAPPARAPQTGLSLLMPSPETLFQPRAAPVAAPPPQIKTPVEAKAQAEVGLEVHGAASAAAQEEITPAAAPAGEAAVAASPTTSAEDKPPPVAVAALPAHQAQNDNGAAPVEGSDGSATPTDIGEAAALALPIVLPQERPLALRKLDRRRAYEARPNQRHEAKLRRRPKHTPVRSARRAPQKAMTRVRETKQPKTADSFDLFTALFGPPPQAAGTPRPGRP